MRGLSPGATQHSFLTSLLVCVCTIVLFVIMIKIVIAGTNGLAQLLVSEGWVKRGNTDEF
jgi:hypothetical protein